MEDLPNILVRKIFLPLPFTEITRVCSTNKQLNKAICHFQPFWYDKLVLDYSITEKFTETLDWKRIYIHYLYRLIGLGSNEFAQITSVAVKDVACGSHHTVIIDIDGNLWGTGVNYNGELGINVREEHVRNLVKLTHELKFIQVACGSHHTLALSNDNKIWVTGSNSVGQIGLSIKTRTYGFIELKGHRAKQIACGENHSAFIDSNGNLYTFGHRFDHKLGRDVRDGYEIPGKVSIPGNIPVIQVSCGVNHTACIDANNEIWVFGSNQSGELGLGETEFRIRSQIEYPIKIPNHKAKFIFCGDYHTAFIDLRNHVWTFGNNKLGQLGLGLQGIKLVHYPMEIAHVCHEGQIIKRDFRVKQVYCIRYITLFIDFENNLWVTGRNEKLSIESKVPAMIPRIKASKVVAGVNHMVMIGYFD